MPVVSKSYRHVRAGKPPWVGLSKQPHAQALEMNAAAELLQGLDGYTTTPLSPGHSRRSPFYLPVVRTHRVDFSESFKPFTPGKCLAGENQIIQ
jgi:hypothetical protein